MGDVILALSFGKPATAGGNALTAKWAGIFSGGKVPVVSDVSVPLNLDNRNLIYWIGSTDPEKHVSTLTLTRKFAWLYKRKGWNSVIVVCSPDYANRVVRDLKRALREVKSSAIISKAELDGEENSNDWYRGSEQWWTKIRIIFKIYEQILRCMPFRLYDKIST